MIILTKTRHVTMTQKVPMVSRNIKRTIEMKCVTYVESLGRTLELWFGMNT